MHSPREVVSTSKREQEWNGNWFLVFSHPWRWSSSVVLTSHGRFKPRTFQVLRKACEVRAAYRSATVACRFNFQQGWQPGLPEGYSYVYKTAAATSPTMLPATTTTTRKIKWSSIKNAKEAAEEKNITLSQQDQAEERNSFQYSHPAYLTEHGLFRGGSWVSLVSVGIFGYHCAFE